MLSQSHSKTICHIDITQSRSPTVKKSNGVVRPDTKDLVDIVLATATTGRKSLALLDQVTQVCKDADGKRWHRCNSVNTAGERCKGAWTNRAKDRILPHVINTVECGNWSVEIRLAAEAALKIGAPSEMAAQVIEETKLVLRTDDTLTHMWTKSAIAKLQLIGHLAVVKAVCRMGWAPSVVGRAAFIEMASELSSGHYTPVSVATLRDSHIPKEALAVRGRTYDYLKSDEVKYVTLTIDGGAIRNRQSFLSVHATDDQRRAFCLDLYDITNKSHTGDLFTDIMIEVCNSLPCEHI